MVGGLSSNKYKEMFQSQNTAVKGSFPLYRHLPQSAYSNPTQDFEVYRSLSVEVGLRY